MDWSRVISLIDLTSLHEQDTDTSILTLCNKAVTPLAPVAAVCIYPRFIALAAKQLVNVPIKIATVVNFPHGTDSLEKVLADIKASIAAGAQEIDMVLPPRHAQTFLQTCKQTCGQSVTLKVILETGMLTSPAIAKASYLALTAGADFIKTSTGKVAQGATLEATRVMLQVIKEMSAQQGRPLGLKVSGGIRDISQALEYLQLAEEIMGQHWVSSKTFRFGASQLLDNILAESKDI